MLNENLCDAPQKCSNGEQGNSMCCTLTYDQYNIVVGKIVVARSRLLL